MAGSVLCIYTTVVTTGTNQHCSTYRHHNPSGKPVASHAFELDRIPTKQMMWEQRLRSKVGYRYLAFQVQQALYQGT